MEIVITVAVFIVMILVLVVSHEFGHFALAKFFGVRVEEFGVGIPPRVWGKKRGETLYSINALPLGGFVRLTDEEGEASDPRGFAAQPYFRKSLIVAAGVIANVLMAYAIFTFLAWFGTPRVGVLIESIVQNSPADIAGFTEGDVIVGLGGTEKRSVGITDVQDYVSAAGGGDAVVYVLRNNSEIKINVRPRVNPPEGEGALGIVMRGSPVNVGFIKTPFYLAPVEGAKTTYSFTKLLLNGLADFTARLFTKGEKLAEGDVGGPVLIAVFAKEAFDVGMRQFFQLLAIISLNLAVINILPIPALDGGRLLFFAIEKTKGKPIPARVSGAIHSAFFVLLIIFLFWITYKDIIFLTGLSP